MSHHVQRDHQNVQLTAQRALSRHARAFLLLAAALPSACGMFLESYSIDDSRLRSASCQLGEQRCVGDWLLTCASTLDGWVDSQSCDAPNRCDSAQGTCHACGNGEYRCDGQTLQRCNADRSGWDTLDTCAAGSACNLNLQACAPCTPNEYQCNGGALTQCTAQGTWGTPTQCGAPELCVVSQNRTSGQCLPSAKCQPRAYDCQGERLVRCNEQGAAFLEIETCGSETLCRQGLTAASSRGVMPACTRPSCDVNEAHCDGNQLSVCSPDRTGRVPGRQCSSDNPCNPKLRDCGRCTPGESFCAGPDLLICDANGVFQKQQTCVSSALCDVHAGACLPPDCSEPGRASCDATEPLLYVCSDGLHFDKSSCGTGALCNPRDARCETPLCEAQSVRCDGQNLQHCRTDRTGWDTDLMCDAGSTCDPLSKSCVSSTCQSGSYRCNDVFLERCTAAGAFQRVARCALTSLCQANMGVCASPECMPGTFHCVGKYLQRCDETLKWRDFETCNGQCDEASGKCL